jgi:hypothetical protein
VSSMPSIIFILSVLVFSDASFISFIVSVGIDVIYGKFTPPNSTRNQSRGSI